MAILTCPTCGTSYEIQAVFPPEGRKARCYKCGQIWLATPDARAEPPPSQAAPTGSASGAGPAESAEAASLPETAAPLKTPPQSATAVKVPQEFSGTIQSPPQPAASLAKSVPDQDLAANVGPPNKKVIEQTAAASAQEERGGIFARLDRLGVSPVAVPSSIASEGLADAAMTDAMFSADAAMDDESSADAEMGIDSVSAAQVVPDEKPATWKPLAVAIGWLVLALVVASVIGSLVLAPSAVVSALPGAARLYALFGVPVGSDALAFEGMHYVWTTPGGQDVLEVHGDVVNNTSNTVHVPTLVIALQDEHGKELSQWTTETSAQELAAGERAPFLRQIPAPPSNVRSVRVRFAKHD